MLKESIKLMNIWLNMKIGSYKKLEDLAKTKELSTSTKYSSFQESIKVTS